MEQRRRVRAQPVQIARLRRSHPQLLHGQAVQPEQSRAHDRLRTPQEQDARAQRRGTHRAIHKV